MSAHVAVVGAGYGGLSTAIVLARLGLRVTLVEAAARPGGCLRSYSREGVDCPVGVHYIGSALPGQLLGDFFDVLEIRPALKLRRLGQRGVIDRFVLDDDVFDLPDTVEKLEASLTARFGDTPAAVAYVMDLCRGAMASLRTDGSAAPPPTLPITKTAALVLAEQKLPPRLVDILALQGFLLGVNLSVCPASFLMMATASLLQSAWELGCTGAEMADAMAERALAAGVTIVAGDPVVAVEVSHHRVSGLRLESGAAIAADSVVASIHPKSLVDMIPAGALPADYRAGIGALDETAGSLCAVALLDEKRHPALDHNVYRVRGEPGRNLAGVYAQLRPSEQPGTTRLTILAESDYASWAEWHDTQIGRRGPAYRAEKLRRAQQAMDEVATAIGPIHEPRIIDVWTPLTMRDWTGARRGGTYGVRHSIRDGLEFLVLSRPPLDGLFMVGQSALAPGLLGVSMAVLRVATVIAGRQAVRELMSSVREDRARVS
jgi:phytoene dehydrogenase-like protein